MIHFFNDAILAKKGLHDQTDYNTVKQCHLHCQYQINALGRLHIPVRKGYSLIRTRY